jgi:hypothetical protein
MRGISLVLVTLFFCAFSTSVIAAKLDKCSPWPECRGDSGGDDSSYIQTNYSNAVIWGKDDPPNFRDLGFPYEIDEFENQTTRNCGPGSQDPVIPPNPDVDIKYVCHSDADFLYGRDSWNTVYLDLSALQTVGPNPGQLNASGRNWQLCERLVDTESTVLAIIPKKEKEPPEGLGCMNTPDPYCEDNEPANVGRLSSYFYVLDESNDEPCIPGGSSESSCKVRIFTQGYFYNECNDSGTKCGRRIGIEAYGHVLPASQPGEGEPIEINPFIQSQIIVIEELNGFFMGIGTNRTEANCYFNNINGDGFWHEGLVFRTCVDVDEDGSCDSTQQP